MAMASLCVPTNSIPPSYNRRLKTKPAGTPHSPEPGPSIEAEQTNALTVAPGTGRGAKRLDLTKLKEREARERKEETNGKIASQKAISIIMRREATKAVIEKKKGNSKKLLPRTVLEALHERITALRWESALKVKGCFDRKTMS